MKSKSSSLNSVSQASILKLLTSVLSLIWKIIHRLGVKFKRFLLVIYSSALLSANNQFAFLQNNGMVSWFCQHIAAYHAFVHIHQDKFPLTYWKYKERSLQKQMYLFHIVAIFYFLASLLSQVFMSVLRCFLFRICYWLIVAVNITLESFGIDKSRFPFVPLEELQVRESKIQETLQACEQLRQRILVLKKQHAEKWKVYEVKGLHSNSFVENELASHASHGTMTDAWQLYDDAAMPREFLREKEILICEINSIKSQIKQMIGELEDLRKERKENENPQTN